MSQSRKLPEPAGAASGGTAISARNGAVAAYRIDQVNNHVTVDGLAALQEFLELFQSPQAPAGDTASQIKDHLRQAIPSIGVQELVADELSRLRALPEFALDDYNDYDAGYAQALAERVIEATRLPVAAVAALAYWGDPDTNRWWMADLQRLARIRRLGGSNWLINLPLIAATMLFYAAGVASICTENYARLTKLFALHGEPLNVAGEQPLTRMLQPNPSTIKLSATENHRAVSSTLTALLPVDSEIVDEAWQTFEILRLAMQLMDSGSFDEAVGTYTAAIRRANATAGIDQTAPFQAAADQNRALEGLAARCHADGLHLLAVEKVYTPGTSFRWGSPVAEWVAAAVRREGDRHPLVGGFDIGAERIEVALRAVSHAVAAAAARHPAYWRGGAAPAEIWLDS